MPQVGILENLEEDERILHESSICDVEFDKQEDTLRQIFGEKMKGRVVCKAYLTNKRILMWLLVVPEKRDMEPKSDWLSFPYERIINKESGKRRRRYNKTGLELEFLDLFSGELPTRKEEATRDVGLRRRWIIGPRGDKTKLWLFVPDSRIWDLKITEMMKEKGLA